MPSAANILVLVDYVDKTIFSTLSATIPNLLQIAIDETRTAILELAAEGNPILCIASIKSDDTVLTEQLDELQTLGALVIRNSAALRLNQSSISFSDSQWHVDLGISIAVLAGGKSSRMGQDKSLLPMAGQTMIEHIIAQLRPWTEELFIGANYPQTFAFTGLPVIMDAHEGFGPLMGIASCLEAAGRDRLFVLACDIPEIPSSFLHALTAQSLEADIVMPIDLEGRSEPLMAIYSKKSLPAMKAMLERGARRIVSILSTETLTEFDLSVVYVQSETESWYKNLNTKAEYEMAKK